DQTIVRLRDANGIAKSKRGRTRCRLLGAKIGGKRQKQKNQERPSHDESPFLGPRSTFAWFGGNARGSRRRRGLYRWFQKMECEPVVRAEQEVGREPAQKGDSQGIVRRPRDSWNFLGQRLELLGNAHPNRKS